MNILVSACLLGVSCRYNSVPLMLEHLDELKKKHNIIPVCPELLGGMGVPREPSEIRQGRVYSKSGKDVTDYYKRGAAETAALAKLLGCTCAVFKERSPSCGCGIIYDGSFSGKMISGNGVAAQALLDNGIKVIGESSVVSLL